eukprot:Nk52_evm5s152 gene=Nk52_evmTU5s152
MTTDVQKCLTACTVGPDHEASLGHPFKRHLRPREGCNMPNQPSFHHKHHQRAHITDPNQYKSDLEKSEGTPSRPGRRVYGMLSFSSDGLDWESRKRQFQSVGGDYRTNDKPDMDQIIRSRRQFAKKYEQNWDLQHRVWDADNRRRQTASNNGDLQYGIEPGPRGKGWLIGQPSESERPLERFMGQKQRVHDKRNGLKEYAGGDKSYSTPEYSRGFHKGGTSLPLVNFGRKNIVMGYKEIFLPLIEPTWDREPRPSYRELQMRERFQEAIKEVEGLDDWTPKAAY